MKTLLLIALLAAGCSASRIKFTKPDGTSGTAWNGRLFWQTEAFQLAASTNTLNISLQKSQTDSTTISTVTAAAVSAAIQSAK